MKNPFGIRERKCRKSDYLFFRKIIKDTLYDYVTEYFPFDFEHVKNSFDKTYKEVTILMKGKKRIGLYQLTPHGKKLEITRIFLIPSYQGKGIGKWYFSYFEILGYKEIFLECWDNNPAIGFYKLLGYKKVKTEKHKVFMKKAI